ncbi:tyrosine-type recombinase/integrase [Paraburkholderia fungorum]|uniref:tyrosine-type recombinase/integrase n=1 Tax=Paraburkholderia TaxID=1822464 RepID=UPI0038BC1B4F
MKNTLTIPDETAIQSGNAVFRPDMPVYGAVFGSDVWPFEDSSSEEYAGPTSSSFVWRDYMEGRGTTYQHPASTQMSRFALCLTPQIVHDLKISAYIHGHHPKVVKNSRASTAKLKPITVQARTEELAKFFSHVIILGKEKYDISVRNLSDISFSLLKAAIATFKGRSASLKRALNLITDPIIQRNLSAPLQWTFHDLKSRSVAWRVSPDYKGIPTLRDDQFLFLLEECKLAITTFKAATGMKIHDSECRALEQTSEWVDKEMAACAIDAYFEDNQFRTGDFERHFGYSLSQIDKIIDDGNAAAMTIILLLSGMRRTEVRYVKRECLVFEHGYWFLKSKEVKGKPKDMPISEGWLAIDLTRDAYDILMYITKRTGNNSLFSTPFRGFTVRSNRAYSPSTIGRRIAKWIEKIDAIGFFEDWMFSIHQLRETLAAQLANQQVSLPFISMQLKHFHSQFNSMPNEVTVGYGQYRKQLMTSVANRIATAREDALNDIFGEEARFAGGGAEEHKARIDSFFSGLGLFGEARAKYIRDMARRGVKLMPTSIGHCAKNFLELAEDELPPCYGDYHCDPNCSSHVITERSADTLKMRREYALNEAELEAKPAYKVIWLGMAQQLDTHIKSLDSRRSHG